MAQPPAISSTKLATRSAARGALPDARIERAVTRLAQRGDPRAVIALVERWSQTGEPTPRARLAQVRAFLDLAMTDRAWTRLQDGADASPVDRAGADPAASDPLDAEARLDGLRLTARMFLDRGWPKRAIPVLDASLALAPDDAELLALRARAEQPARRPPPDDAVPADAPAAERLALAEACLATGAFLRARRLLEQLTAAPPTDPTHAARADDLLWALRGDYDVAESLADLVAAAEDLDLAPEQDEHTSATAHLGPRPARPSPAPHRPAGEPALDPADLGVPDLFGMAAPASEGVPDGALGGARPGEAPEAPGEVTQATRMLDLRSGEGALGGGDRDEDTQVLRVFATPGASTEAPVAAPARPATTTEGVEREDEAVVQLTDAAAALPPPKVALPLPIPTPPRPSGSPDAPHDAPGGPRAEPMVLLDDAQIDPLEDDPLLPGWAKLALAGLILGALALVAAAYLGASSP